MWGSESRGLRGGENGDDGGCGAEAWPREEQGRGDGDGDGEKKAPEADSVMVGRRRQGGHGLDGRGGAG